VLYTFCAEFSTCSEGVYPFAGLTLANDGNFYGTTYGSSGGDCTQGSALCGTIFRITPGGVLTTLYRFCRQPKCSDGSFPYAVLIQATDGQLYGTTEGEGERHLFGKWDLQTAIFFWWHAHRHGPDGDGKLHKRLWNSHSGQRRSSMKLCVRFHFC
jgi:uncharacterized repeat protein (TIGR03803 family)